LDAAKQRLAFMEAEVQQLHANCSWLLECKASAEAAASRTACITDMLMQQCSEVAATSAFLLAENTLLRDKITTLDAGLQQSELHIMALSLQLTAALDNAAAARQTHQQQLQRFLPREARGKPQHVQDTYLDFVVQVVTAWWALAEFNGRTATTVSDDAVGALLGQGGQGGVYKGRLSRVTTTTKGKHPVTELAHDRTHEVRHYTKDVNCMIMHVIKVKL
jgi:hypothetical protein